MEGKVGWRMVPEADCMAVTGPMVGMSCDGEGGGIKKCGV